MSRAPGAFSTAIKRPIVAAEYDAPNRVAASRIRARLAGFSTPSARNESVNRGPIEVGLRSHRLALHVRASSRHAPRAGGVRAGLRGARARGQGRGPA